MDLIFFGMQGAGKGTISKLVAEKYGMEIFETGGQLRKLAQSESELGKKIKSIIEAGHLVSNEIVMEMVEDFIKNLKGDTQVIFDGIPRSVEQAGTLNSLLDKFNRNYRGLLIEIKKDTALTRLTTRRICDTCKTVYPATYTEEKCKCGGELITRKDDNPEAIENRLKAFEESTIPAIEMYADSLIKIDGEPAIEEVKNSTFTILDSIMR